MNLTRVKLVTIGEDRNGIGTFGHAMADASRECGGHCIKMWASEKEPALLNVLRASEYNEVHDDMLRTPRNVLPAATTISSSVPLTSTRRQHCRAFQRTNQHVWGHAGCHFWSGLNRSVFERVSQTQRYGSVVVCNGRLHLSLVLFIYC